VVAQVIAALKERTILFDANYLPEIAVACSHSANVNCSAARENAYMCVRITCVSVRAVASRSGPQSFSSFCGKVVRTISERGCGTTSATPAHDCRSIGKHRFSYRPRPELRQVRVSGQNWGLRCVPLVCSARKAAVWLGSQATPRPPLHCRRPPRLLLSYNQESATDVDRAVRLLSQRCISS
jgi:hypothetical protein